MAVTTEDTLVTAPVVVADDEAPEQAPPAAAPEDSQESAPPVRLAAATGLATTAAAVLVGGVFAGASGRVYAAATGLLGVGLAVVLSRTRVLWRAYAAMVVGLFAIGLAAVVPSGIGAVGNLRALVASAVASGDVLRPPAPMTPGWQAVIGWLMGTTGFLSTWVALVVGTRAVGLFFPLPVAAIAAISVPQQAQVPSGIAGVVVYLAALGVLSSANAVRDDEQRLPLAYELRRSARALPVMAALTVVLVVLARADFLLPQPIIDPTRQPQKPKTVPLSDVEDRVLFTVTDTTVSGPWRIGSLDVYDGEDWRLPPFADSELVPVGADGIVDDTRKPGLRATIRTAGLTGAILPVLPNPVGIIARGPQLAFDRRSGNIRTSEGQVSPGFEYTVTAAAIPAIDELKTINEVPPSSFRTFLQIAEPPPAAAGLLAQASGSPWERFDFVRTWVLDNVAATGTGVPVGVTPERAGEILGPRKEASPFEIVAVQAMLARWVGLPSRIGYGFDGGEVRGERDEILEVRPKHGATFVEVWFPRHGWLPVLGTPKQAKSTVGSDPQMQQTNPNIIPSDDIAVRIILPVPLPGDEGLARQLALLAAVVFPVALVAFAAWVVWPGVHKWRVRSRRRRLAFGQGARARIALAYSEFRDHCADFGYHHPSETPLHFVARFADDPEHLEFAWFVTRALWGDLQHDLTPELATAVEDVSRNLRKRVSAAQPATVRVVAALSRISMYEPYDPDAPMRARPVKLASRLRRGRHKEDRRALAGV